MLIRKLVMLIRDDSPPGSNILYSGNLGPSGTFKLCDTGSVTPLPHDYSMGLCRENIVVTPTTREYPLT